MMSQASLYPQELISEDVHEIISCRPHWIVTKGSAILLLVILSVLSLTWFVRYPDVISASARLVATDPPKLIRAKVEGRLLKLFVINEDTVTKNQHLGQLESTADYEQVARLQGWINKAVTATEENNFDNLVSDPLPRLADLGELQANYQDLENGFAEIKQTLVGGYYRAKRYALQEDIRYLTSLKDNTALQRQLADRDRQLEQNEYNAYESLAADKIIAPIELNQFKSKLIAKDQSLQQMDAQLTNSDVSRHNKEKELLDLQKTITDEQQKFRSALLDMKSQVEGWIRNYILIAPEGGKVLFISSLRQNELIAEGQGVFYIQPNQNGFHAEIMIGQKGSGKIQKGQKVILKTDGYPSEEFGYLNGVVGYISGVPNSSDSFLVLVNLPAGLETNYKSKLFFRNNLSARAEIVTDDRTLFDRLIGHLQKLFEK